MSFLVDISMKEAFAAMLIGRWYVLFLLAGCGEVGARFYVLDKPQVTSTAHVADHSFSQVNCGRGPGMR